MNNQLVRVQTSAFRKVKPAVSAQAKLGIAALRLVGLTLLVVIGAWLVLAVYLLSSGERWMDALIPVTAWRIERRVDAEHPLVKAWAADIRTITSVPREQAALAEEAVWHLVRYWNTHDRDENDFIPSIDDLIDRAKSHQWSTLRGNCVSESVMLCSLLRSLGLPAQIKNSPFHAWVEFQVDGQTLCTLLPELSLSREADLPSAISGVEAKAAAHRLGADNDGVFHEIALLPDSRSEDIPHFRCPFYLALLVPVLAFWFSAIKAWDRVTAVKPAKKISVRTNKKAAVCGSAERSRELELVG